MENKYYTPGIEEFYVGFEYEFRDTDGDWWVKRIPCAEDIVRLENATALVENKENLPFRVKYLDQKDIESFGFVENSSGEFILKSNEDITSNFFLIRKHNHFNNKFTIEKYFYISNDGYNKFHKFEGIIKNKSELKRILQQIGIV